MSLLADILKLDPALVASRDDAEIARLLSVGKTRLVPTEIGNGTILETIGLDSGNALLDELSSNATYRHVQPLLEQGRLRVDSQLVRLTLDALAEVGTISVAQAEALKALASVPNPVSVGEVSDALNAGGY
jgi:hypothetical protein